MPRYGWTWNDGLAATTFHLRNFAAPTRRSTVSST